MNKKILYLVGLVGLVIVVGAVAVVQRRQVSNSSHREKVNQTTITQPQEATEASEVRSNEAEGLVFDMNEVALHNRADDCWLVIDGKIYDVTGFVAQHPGGQAIVQGCGRDATELFETRPMGSQTPHSDQARRKLAEFLIGEVAQ